MLLLTHSKARDLIITPPHPMEIIHEPLITINLRPPQHTLQADHIILTSSYAYDAIKEHVPSKTALWSLSIPKTTCHTTWHTPPLQNSQSLIALFLNKTTPKDSGQILFARGSTIRHDFTPQLREMGYEIDSYIAYEQSLVDHFSPSTLSLLKDKRITHVAFHSISALKNFEHLCVKFGVATHHLTPLFLSKHIAEQAHHPWQTNFLIAS